MLYEKAGVNINIAQNTLNNVKNTISQTYTKNVLSNTGNFGGLYSIDKNNILVSSTDGVGTKVELGKLVGSYYTFGIDIVNHCINDILVQGAKPLFFLDYLGFNKINPKSIEEIIKGISDACKKADCALIGGELAEMQDVYRQDSIDIVGTIIGSVSKDNLITGKDIKDGDVVLGLKSSGLHTNGFSLARKVLEKAIIKDDKLLNSLVTPHKTYLDEINELRKSVSIKGLVHITGGGFYDNPQRILDKELCCVIDTNSWETPEVFNRIRKEGNISQEEMYKVFNMGIGMLIVIDKNDISKASHALDDKSIVIGKIIKDRQDIILE
tara:strand:+ start:2832 stop:3806 length:975 start_codon:yes stop_codon:yes gene_type:complete